jgi:hypothetical protein
MPPPSPSIADSLYLAEEHERPAQRRRIDDFSDAGDPPQQQRDPSASVSIPSRGLKIEKIPTFEGKGIREY